MSHPQLEPLMALNDQLAALIDAGAAIETGLGTHRGQVRSKLQEINVTVARRVSQGRSLDEALGGEPAFYRTLVNTALTSRRLEVALQASSRLADTGKQAVQIAAFSLVYPVVLVLLAYVGLVCFCLWLVPILEEIYFSANVAPHAALSTLASLRRSLPYWSALPPVSVVVIVLLARRAIMGSSSVWVPGWQRVIGPWRARDEARAANLANMLAALLESGQPLAEALQWAAVNWRGNDPETATRKPPSHHSPAESGTDQPFAGPPPDAFPPLLRWALYEAEPTIGRSAALRIAADTYQASAQRRLERWRFTAPALLCIVVGGGATLLYGLALFVPVVDLLEGLARP